MKDVRLTDGTLVKNIPDDWSKEEFQKKALQNGITPAQLGLSPVEAASLQGSDKSDAVASDIMNKLDYAHSVLPVKPEHKAVNNPYAQGMMETNSTLDNDMSKVNNEKHNVIPMLYAVAGTKESDSKYNPLKYVTPYHDSTVLTPDDVEAVKEDKFARDLLVDGAAWYAGEGEAKFAMSMLAKYGPEGYKAAMETMKASKYGRFAVKTAESGIKNLLGSINTQLVDNGSIDPVTTAEQTVSGVTADAGGHWLLGGGEQGAKLYDDVYKAKTLEQAGTMKEAHDRAFNYSLKEFGKTWEYLREKDPNATFDEAVEFWKKEQPNIFKRINKKEPLANPVLDFVRANPELTPEEIQSIAGHNLNELDKVGKPKAEALDQDTRIGNVAEANKQFRNSKARMKGSMKLNSHQLHSSPLVKMGKSLDAAMGYSSVWDEWLGNKAGVTTEDLNAMNEDLTKRVTKQRNYYQRMAKEVEKIPKDERTPSQKARLYVANKNVKQYNKDIDLLKDIRDGKEVKMKRNGNAWQKQYIRANEERFNREISDDLEKYLSQVDSIRLAESKGVSPSEYKKFSQVFNDAFHNKISWGNFFDEMMNLANEKGTTGLGYTMKTVMSFTGAPLVATGAGVVSRARESAILEDVRSVVADVMAGKITKDEGRAIFERKAARTMAIYQGMKIITGDTLYNLNKQVNEELDEEHQEYLNKQK
ncbi:TPA: hypothetical protein OUD88_002862 [Enterobacter hormaechei]|nr:hypothetical protein [Enterobacter hormaechei]